VASGPYDARVSPDGLKVAYWFTGRRRFCLPIDPSCSVRETDTAAYAFTDRVTDPLELGVVRELGKPAARKPPRAFRSLRVARRGDAAPPRPAGREGEARAGAVRPPRAAAAPDRPRAGEGDHDRLPPRQPARLTPTVRSA
jgi:hypothetical protein